MLSRIPGSLAVASVVPALACIVLNWPSIAPPALAATKPLAIVGASWLADQTDYPIEIIVHKGSGTDSGAHIYLDDDVRDDFGDLRFTDSAGGDLAYWVESITSSDARIWVKVPRIPRSGSTSIWISSGNPAATSLSNGPATFLFYDGFDDDSQGDSTNGLAPPGWEQSLVYSTVDWYIASGILHFRGDGHITTLGRVWPNPGAECAAAGCFYTMRFRAQWPLPAWSNPGENGETVGGVADNTTDGSAWYAGVGRFQFFNNQKFLGSAGDTSGFEDKEFAATDYGSFHIWEIDRKTDSTAFHIVNVGESHASTYVMDDDLYLVVHGCHFEYATSPYVAVDWMLLRKQVHPGPSVGTPSSNSFLDVPTTGAAGGTVTVTWSGIASPTLTDWIGLYTTAAADATFIDWLYVSCSKTPGDAVASGSCAFPIPASLAPGTYQLRLFSNDGFTKLATSNNFTVTSGSGGPTLTVSLTKVAVGGSVTATWSGIASPTLTDWIGLYTTAAADATFIDWLYVSCSKTPGDAVASGSCAFPIPASLAPGTYQLRLFSNDGFTGLATSNNFTVTQ